MLQLLELLPLLVFFGTYSLSGHHVDIGSLHYQLDGIYSATAALMAITTVQVGVIWAWKRQLENRYLWMLGLVLVCGTATLVFHNSLFIQWKPTLLNWAFALALLGSHFLTDKNLVQRMLGQHLQLPDAIMRRLLWVWTGYFILVGALNLLVAYHFPEATWVKYKLWSFIAYSLLISVVTAWIVTPHLSVNMDNDDKKPPEKMLR